MPAMNRKFQRSDRRFAMSAAVRLPSTRPYLPFSAALVAPNVLSNLRSRSIELEFGRRLERVVVAHQRRAPCRSSTRTRLRRGVADLLDVLGQLLGLEERRHRHGFLRFLVDHDRHADAAVRVAAARELAEFLLGAVRHVGPVGEAAHERDREPVADRLADAGLVLHVVRQVRQRVALRVAALVGDFLVAAGERHRLEREEVDLLRVVERELDDAADLLVVHAVDDGDDRDDVDAGGCRGSRSPAASRRTGCRRGGARWPRCRCRQTADTRSGGPASAAFFAYSGLLANSMPLVAACTLL